MTISDYPNLEKLGVTSVNQVVKYNLTRDTRVDILKIYYKRKKGSLLASSKKYHFVRGQNHPQDNHQEDTSNGQHVSPQLLHVIEELRTLMTNRPIEKRSEKMKNIAERLDSLEAVFESKIMNLKKNLENMDH